MKNTESNSNANTNTGFAKFKNDFLQLIKLSIIPMMLIKGLKLTDVSIIIIPFMIPYFCEIIYILYKHFTKKKHIETLKDTFYIYRMKGSGSWYNKTFNDIEYWISENIDNFNINLLEIRDFNVLQKADNKTLFLDRTKPILSLPFDIPINYKLGDKEIIIELKKKADTKDGQNQRHNKEFFDSFFKVSCENNNIFDEFIKKCESTRNDKLATINKEFYKLYEYNNCNDSKNQWVKKNINICKTFNNTFLPENLKEKISRILNDFIDPKSIDKRNKYGVPHKLGLLLYGIRGCGKSALVYAVANYTKRNIYKINLNNVVDLEKAFGMIPAGNIVFIEEIDTVSFTNKRKGSHNTLMEYKMKYLKKNNNKPDENNTQGKLEIVKNSNENDDDSDDDNNMTGYSKEKLGTLLCILDGYHCLEDTIIFMTTNHKDDLDDSLIRPGRIDHHVEFKKITRHQIKNIITYYYSVKIWEYILNNNLDVIERIENKITTSTLINTYIIHNTDDHVKMIDEIKNTKKFVN
jgi:hypothetical protein